MLRRVFVLQMLKWDHSANTMFWFSNPKHRFTKFLPLEMVKFLIDIMVFNVFPFSSYLWTKRGQNFAALGQSRPVIPAVGIVGPGYSWSRHILGFSQRLDKSWQTGRILEKINRDRQTDWEYRGNMAWFSEGFNWPQRLKKCDVIHEGSQLAF